MNNNPCIRVETQSTIVDIGYFAPLHLRKVIVTTDRRTQFRIRMESQGFSFTVSVNGTPKAQRPTICSVTAVPGDKVTIEIHHKDDSLYSREVTLEVKEDDVASQHCPDDVELLLEKQTRRDSLIVSKKSLQALKEYANDHDENEEP